MARPVEREARGGAVGAEGKREGRSVKRADRMESAVSSGAAESLVGTASRR